MKYYTMSEEEVLKELNSTPEGLNDQEVKKRQRPAQGLWLYRK